MLNSVDYHIHLSEIRKEMSFDIKGNNSKIYQSIKRLLDITLSIIGLIVGVPLVILFGALIYLESPGNIIFKQQRVGKDGEVFTLYKLRSMGLDAEKNGQKWAAKNDDRVLKVGQFIRKTRIDEIPQLLNILKGEMTIVGPRPEVPKFTVEFHKEHPGFIDRVKVTPGLTGLAQVSGGYDMTPDQKLEKDLEYIRKQNLVLDLNIMLRTVSVILTGDGAR